MIHITPTAMSASMHVVVFIRQVTLQTVQYDLHVNHSLNQKNRNRGASEESALKADMCTLRSLIKGKAIRRQNTLKWMRT
jgi:hypothetical protein